MFVIFHHFPPSERSDKSLLLLPSLCTLTQLGSLCNYGNRRNDMEGNNRGCFFQFFCTRGGGGRPACFHYVKSKRTCAEAASACCSCCCSCFLSSWIWCSSELEASAKGAPKMGEFSRRGGLSAPCGETEGTGDFSKNG